MNQRKQPHPARPTYLGPAECACKRRLLSDPKRAAGTYSGEP